MEVLDPVHIHILPFSRLVDHKVLPHLSVVLLKLLQARMTNMTAGPPIELRQNTVKWIPALGNVNKRALFIQDKYKHWSV